MVRESQLPNNIVNSLLNIDGFCGELPFKCFLPEVASVGDWLKICPWVAYRTGTHSHGEIKPHIRIQNNFVDILYLNHPYDLSVGHLWVHRVVQHGGSEGWAKDRTDLGLRDLGSGSWVCGLGCRVWSLRPGAEGLGFGV